MITLDNLYTFIRLVNKMYAVQQQFFKGNNAVFKQAKAIESKVDAFIAKYDNTAPQLVYWQNAFVQTVADCRAAQQKYFKERLNLNKLRARDCEKHLSNQLIWLYANVDGLLVKEYHQANLLN
jgi:hypothetical protein